MLLCYQMQVSSVKMANIHDLPATCSSSSSPPETNDDISIFLHQILLKSSSSSFSPQSIATNNQIQCEIPRLSPVYTSGFSAPDRTPTLSSPNDAYFGANASSVGTIDNGPNEYDCESQGFENLTEEMAAKSNPNRNPSKRSRAADVHNMSEKRRRSRINEKMKALQKLIPNANKTDKASMLDEVIEYLKQLQLRVQMLTMKNGGILNSMSVPHEVHQLHPNPMPSLPFESRNGDQSYSNLSKLRDYNVIW